MSELDSTPTTTRPAVSRLHLAGWAICLLVAIGSAGTWASIEGFGVNGLDDGRDGIITLIAAILAAIGIVRCVMKPASRAAYAVAVLGLLVAAVGVVDVIDVSGTGEELFGSTLEVSVGWGLWLTAVAGVGLLVVGVLHAAQARRLRAAA